MSKNRIHPYLLKSFLLVILLTTLVGCTESPSGSRAHTPLNDPKKDTEKSKNESKMSKENTDQGVITGNGSGPGKLGDPILPELESLDIILKQLKYSEPTWVKIIQKAFQPLDQREKLVIKEKIGERCYDENKKEVRAYYTRIGLSPTIFLCVGYFQGLEVPGPEDSALFAYDTINRKLLTLLHELSHFAFDYIRRELKRRGIVDDEFISMDRLAEEEAVKVIEKHYRNLLIAHEDNNDALYRDTILGPQDVKGKKIKEGEGLRDVLDRTIPSLISFAEISDLYFGLSQSYEQRIFKVDLFGKSEQDNPTSYPVLEGFFERDFIIPHFYAYITHLYWTHSRQYLMIVEDPRVCKVTDKILKYGGSSFDEQQLQIYFPRPPGLYHNEIVLVNIEIDKLHPEFLKYIQRLGELTEFSLIQTMTPPESVDTVQDYIFQFIDPEPQSKANP